MKPLYAIAAACLALSAPAAVTANAGRFNGTWTISVTNDNGTGHVQSLTFQQTSPTTALVTTSGINTIEATINGNVASGSLGPMSFRLELTGANTGLYTIRYAYGPGAKTRHGPAPQSGSGYATRR